MLNYLYKYSLMFLALGMLVSCNKDNEAENLFGESPNDRINAQTEELYTALQSAPEGWKVTYFTDDPRYTDSEQQLGGWTFIFKFTDNKHVTMASDFSSETLVPQESEYEVQLGSTVKLVFGTRNYIHLLSDSGNFPTPALEGKGYKGDFEFLYYGKDGEDLIFRSNRFQIELRFQKATAQDWSDLEEARQTGSLLSSSGNFELIINNAGETTTYDSYAYNPASRYAINTEVDSLSFGVAPLADGLKVVKPIPVGDQKATNFVYEAANNQFVAELENGSSAIIKLGDPILISDVVNDYYFTVLGISGSPIETHSTGDFVGIFNDVSAATDEQTDLSFYGFFIAPQFGFVQYLFIDANNNAVRVNRIISNFNVDDNSGILTLTDGGWENSTIQATYESILQPIDEILFDSSGLKVNVEGGLYEGSPIYSLESITYPNIVIGTYGQPY